MKYAADFRQIARDTLRGKWKLAVLTGFVAGLLGGNIVVGNSSYNIDISDYNEELSNLPSTEILHQIYPILVSIFSVIAVWGIVNFIIGGAIKFGYAKFNLGLIDQQPIAFSDLFSHINRIGTGIVMNLVMSIYIFLWSLLFIIPGIIKSYSYAMTPYILSEHPEMSVGKAITESRRIMDGNKGRLFCLNFSFIGWTLLTTIPAFALIPLIFMGVVGIVLYALISIASIVVGSLFLVPYQEAAQAAFYREVSQTNIPPYIPLEQDTPSQDNLTK